GGAGILSYEWLIKARHVTFTLLFILFLTTPDAQAAAITIASVSTPGGGQTGPTDAHVDGAMVVQGVNVAYYGATARARYGSLSTQTFGRIGDTLQGFPGLTIGYTATASFSDSLLFGDSGFIQFDYAFSIGGTTTGNCKPGSVDTSLGGVTSHFDCAGGTFQTGHIPFIAGVPFQIGATVRANGGGAIPGGFDSPEAGFGFRSISLFDAGGTRINSFSYTSESGTDYGISGAIFAGATVPEPASLAPVAIGLAALVFKRKCATHVQRTIP
ncbi:MAG: PEP-CTERM sorting domain-containing protein, partial [Acidobacteriota bacterium]